MRPRPSSICARSQSDRSCSSKRNQGAGGVDPRLSAQVMQQHQRQQAQAFRIFGIDRTQHASEADGFGAQLPPDQRIPRGRGIALVEDQIDDRLHCGPAFGQGIVGRHLVGNARILDLAFGAHQPLRQGRLRNEKGARDLTRRKPAQGAQGQGDLGLAVEGGMAAGEDQPQPIIRNFARQRPPAARDPRSPRLRFPAPAEFVSRAACVRAALRRSACGRPQS